jgi:hypothetical protein
MRWLKKLISRLASEGRIIRRAEDIKETAAPPILGSMSSNVDHAVTPKLRIGFIDAMNGRVLEVATAVPHSHHTGHYDWTVELFIVPEGQNLSEALTMLMLLKGAK